ncbi:MAG TPA: methyltransferase domain-containing protein [Thermomicrobiales bacterium]|nr:methyltransferase domain-containing protein [Thermomicrobiales bacterium]
MFAPFDPAHDTDVASAIERLRASLAHTGQLETERVQIPGTRTLVEITRPIDTNRLLDQVVDDPEQNLPYWSEIWPSGIALAGDIIHHPDRVHGKRVIELGTGVGITAAVAIAHGAELTVIDYAEEALTLTRMTCLRHAGAEPADARRVNWRLPDVAALVKHGHFDVVLAADALYERRDIEPLIVAVETLVASDGAVWLAEPGRKPAEVFLSGMAARGWTGPSTQWNGPWPDPKDAGIDVRTHWLQRET